MLKYFKSFLIAIFAVTSLVGSLPSFGSTSIAESIKSAVYSTYRHAVSPVVRGAVAGGVYIMGTHGLQHLCVANDMKYEGFLKLLGSVGSIILGLSALPGSLEKEEKPGDDTVFKWGLWCVSAVASAAILNGLLKK